MVGTILLRLTVWFLLTANFSGVNILLGLLVAVLLPHRGRLRQNWPELGRGVWRIVRAIPQAYTEALEMMVSPHTREEIQIDPVQPNRTPGLVFLDIFYITFTPKTIVLNYQEPDGYVVHYLKPEPPSQEVSR
ncbi:MAG: Na+/H+ antiporter subunit E [Gloeomargarita sp. HHBFW_bins_162]